MKIVRGWKRISHKGGFISDVTGQTLVIAKEAFREHYHVLLFRHERTDDSQGSKISPEYPTETKAETYAIEWMKKNPKGRL